MHLEPRPTRPVDRVERVGSALAFALLMLCTWIVGYVALVPADPVAHHVHVAQVQA